MRNNKFFLLTLLLITVASATLTSCKKGTDDPIVSAQSRKDRFTNTWTLTKYEKNSTTQDISGTTYIYDVYDNGTVRQTVEGITFGYPIKTERNGTWSFMNDEEDVKIEFTGESTIYQVQRLASKELWLRETQGADTYTYYFDGN